MSILYLLLNSYGKEKKEKAEEGLEIKSYN